MIKGALTTIIVLLTLTAASLAQEDIKIRKKINIKIPGMENQPAMPGKSNCRRHAEYHVNCLHSRIFDADGHGLQEADGERNENAYDDRDQPVRKKRRRSISIAIKRNITWKKQRRRPVSRRQMQNAAVM